MLDVRTTLKLDDDKMAAAITLGRYFATLEAIENVSSEFDVDINWRVEQALRDISYANEGYAAEKVMRDNPLGTTKTANTMAHHLRIRSGHHLRALRRNFPDQQEWLESEIQAYLSGRLAKLKENQKKLAQIVSATAQLRDFLRRPPFTEAYPDLELDNEVFWLTAPASVVERRLLKDQQFRCKLINALRRMSTQLTFAAKGELAREKWMAKKLETLNDLYVSGALIQ